MQKKKVLVVLGGTSREREVSLESARSCILALKKIGYNVLKFDPKFLSLNKINKTKSIISNIWRFKSFRLIKLLLMKVKNVNSPNTMQIKDEAITHL